MKLQFDCKTFYAANVERYEFFSDGDFTDLEGLYQVGA